MLVASVGAKHSLLRLRMTLNFAMLSRPYLQRFQQPPTGPAAFLLED